MSTQDGEPPGMDTQRPERPNRLAPLAQAGLAALVAGSLLAFSALAFRTAFDRPGQLGVTAAAPNAGAAKAVVLPAPSTTPPVQHKADAKTRVAVGPTTGTVVLGKRVVRSAVKPATSPVSQPVARSHSPGEDVDDVHAHHRGKGHEKARGNGHQKHSDGSEWTGETQAREDDEEISEDDHDYEDRDHGDDDSDGHSHGGSGHDNSGHDDHGGSGRD
ncbi:MAG: hypothetical protein QOG04_707 [Actinomycetota bacterium]|nr:hypothetical protein [Actinomycetota bacterium]